MTKKQKSIQKSLALWVLLVIGISIAIFSLVSGASTLLRIRDNTEKNYLAQAESTARQMEDWMNVQIRTVDSYAEAIKTGGYDKEKFSEAEKYLLGLSKVDSDIYALYMGRPDKSCVFSDGWDAAAENYDPTTRDWYTDAIKSDKAVLSVPYNDASTNKMVITISKAIRNNGEITAVIASDIFVTSVIDIADKTANGENMYPILLDSADNIVVHQNHDFVPYVDEQNNDVVTNIADIKPTGCLDAADGSIFKGADYNGASCVFAKQPIGTTGWHLILSTVTSTFYKEIYAIVGLYLGIFALFLVLDTAVLFIIIKKKLSPLKELKSASDAMLNGQLSYTSKYRNSDEIGTTCLATEDALKKILGYVNDIDDKLHNMAEGKFNNEMELDYIGDFSNIKNSMVIIQDSLRNTLTKINDVAGEVAGGSDQLSTAAMELSNGASKQAEAVDGLANALNSVAKTAQDTAENAGNAADIVTEMGRNVSECTDSMEQLIEAMKHIDATSEEIKKINKTVEDIAFQTNILALNAAIEASRAGAAGKGFAVVADEVRNLASKSAEAASITTKLIMESSEAVGKGTELTKTTANSLGTIVGGVNSTVDIVHKIVSNSSEGEKALRQITSEIGAISAVVRSNTETAEESAASSAALKEQAAKLKNMTDGFEL